jgi:hypothetical protein
MGLDPNNTCWPQDLHPVFNIGLPGSGVYMQARMLQHAIAGNDVKIVLWGLDYLDFISMDESTSDQWRWPPQRKPFEDRLMVNADGSENPDYNVKIWRDYLNTLFSLDTLKDSLKTLFGQANIYSSTLRRDGFNPALDYLDIIASEGQSVLFQQKNDDISKMLSKPGLKLFQGDSLRSPDFETIRRLLQFSDKHRVKVLLFINPYHADYLASLELAGRWPEFESWKRQLTTLATEFNVELWDFSGINPLSTEQVSAPGDKTTTLKWFWEPAHYRKEFGDLMLSRMLRRYCDIDNTSPVGILLTAENIDSHLMLLRNDMVRYKQEFGSDIERLQ